MLEAFHGFKENNVHIMITELQMLEMNSFKVLILNIFFFKPNICEKLTCSAIFFIFRTAFLFLINFHYTYKKNNKYTERDIKRL